MSDNIDQPVALRFANDDFRMPRWTMAERFGVQTPAVNKHLKNIFASGELRQTSVISILEITAADDKSNATRFYNLYAVIAVGYQQRATRDFHI